MTVSTTTALEVARHELTTLHGLIAADAKAPRETWRIDTSKAVELIDAVLKRNSGARAWVVGTQGPKPCGISDQVLRDLALRAIGETP